MIPKLIMLFHAIAFIGHTNARSVVSYYLIIDAFFSIEKTLKHQTYG